MNIRTFLSPEYSSSYERANCCFVWPLLEIPSIKKKLINGEFRHVSESKWKFQVGFQAKTQANIFAIESGHCPSCASHPSHCPFLHLAFVLSSALPRCCPPLGPCSPRGFWITLHLAFVLPANTAWPMDDAQTKTLMYLHRRMSEWWFWHVARRATL